MLVDFLLYKRDHILFWFTAFSTYNTGTSINSFLDHLSHVVNSMNKLLNRFPVKFVERSKG